MRRLTLETVRVSGRIHHVRRFFSAGRQDAPQQVPKTDQQAAVRSRFDRLIERTPRFLRPTVAGLRQAPVTHVTAFIILHELTAVVPLLALAGGFHYWGWLPPYFTEAAWVSAGVEKFGRYFRRKGWISEKDETEVEERVKQAKAGKFEEQTISMWSDGKQGATSWVVEFATAYAIVKVLLPLRLFVSVWGAPWFARLVVIPVGKATGSIFRRTKS
ncbi:hypothetical protein A1O3_00130 [Capronia epimyces CBS 606.96]|uniref:Uncharacterized protein n=1 Tax=Capronia epimyces CBS 606.96 TaxID=1182542 RepID=W9YFB7_9EURO|nr:uncharacterized protein A1O3_00130 [Capronia epimyces CBS 606.96]EXJ91582.1 hypothetical protein A1O3_00130 [Capronia epimyces CBS 606.96]